jgi:hypothetical protein
MSFRAVFPGVLAITAELRDQKAPLHSRVEAVHMAVVVQDACEMRMDECKRVEVG